MADVPVEPAATANTLSVVVLIAGILLCFAGVRSLRLAAGCAGFGLGSALALLLGGSPLVAMVVGLAGAAGAVLLVRAVFGLAAFAVGALAGGVIVGSALRALPEGTAVSAVVGTLLVLAGAVLCGALVHLLRARVLRVLTALAGAGLIVRAVVELGPSFLGFLRAPATWVESLVALAAWLALAWVGLGAQRARADGG